ncbi:MAG: CDP-glycerol glycerophosphotransferase family protein [Breznakia sp.]
MKLQKLIVNSVLQFCRLFLGFTSIHKNRITFVSLENDHLAGDFLLLSRVLERTEVYEIKYILTKYEKSLLGNIKYFITIIKQFYVINTSRLVILDYNNYVVSNFKREGVKVLQLWHATGAIKRFGNAVDRDYAICNYDYVIVNAPYFTNAFAAAFGVKEQQVHITGIPKTDRLFQEQKIKADRKKMYKEFPQLKNKKVILYAPTFRGRLMKGFKEGYINLDYISEKLSNEYILIYKMHPLLENRIISKHPNVLCCNGMSIKRLFSISDYLISDYSAIIFDFSVFCKPMLFYVPDLEEYRQDVGFYVDYETEMPGPLCKHEDEIIQKIENNDFDMDKIVQFKKKFFAYDDGQSTKRVIDLIQQIMGDSK